MTDMKRLRFAYKNTMWVCAICGRTGKDRYNMGDTSCVIKSVLCKTTLNSDGSYHPVPELQLILGKE